MHVRTSICDGHRHPRISVAALLLLGMAAAPCAAAQAIDTGVPSDDTRDAHRRILSGEDDVTQPAPETPREKAIAELHLAQNAMDDLVARLRTAFRKSPDYADARLALAQAQAALDAARAPVLSAVRSTADYQRASAEKQKAKEALAAARAAGTVPPDQIAQLASDVMASGSRVTKLEAAALAADPNVAAAKAKVAEAAAAVSKLEQQFAASLKDDPQWQAAKKAIDDAKAKAASVGNAE